MEIEEKDSRTHFVFWWIFPSKAISGVFRELAELSAYRVTVVCVGDVVEVRKRLGHGRPNYGKAEMIILPVENWKPEVDRILESSRSAIHIYNSVYAYQRIVYSLRTAFRMKIQTAIMTEAPNNAFYGTKWLAKEVYTRAILPLIVRPLAKRCLFVLCLSGNSQTARRSLRCLGWRDEQIFPFGYFSEQPPDILGAPSTSQPAAETQLLCTGYLTRNKGHHILLRALSLLKKRGLQFHCNITGYGVEEESLRELSESLGLNTYVTFKGIVSEEELGDLMRSADVFVAPGLREAWGIRVSEALQAGLAVVVSDGIAACELVRAAGGGEVFPAGNPERLAEVLFRLISRPAQLAERKESSRNYRQRIHPRVAACYFVKVLHHKLRQNGEKPALPPWL